MQLEDRQAVAVDIDGILGFELGAVADEGVGSVEGFYGEDCPFADYDGLTGGPKRGFELREVGGGWRLYVREEFDDLVSDFVGTQAPSRLSQAALETLAIVAYRQPVTKAEVEAVRGVQAGPILRTLVDRGLVRVTGRAEVPGAPLEYGTTKDFLDRFGLGSLEELPRDAELTRD